MAGINKQIKIWIEYVTKGAAKANAEMVKINKAITAQQRRYIDATKTGKRHIDTTRNNMLANANAGQVMRMNQEVLGRFNKEGRQFHTTQARMANRFRMMTHGARGFRMEMLGVMFFGMAIQRVFTGLLRTSMEWMGVMEILSLTLGILFLPIAEVLLKWALKFLNWVLQLTDTQKKAIGWFVLVGAVVGTLTFLIGTLALGIGSMILAFNFSKIANVITSLDNIGKSAKKTSKKVGGLQTKLSKVARFAGAAILLSIALKDLKDDQVIAAVGGTAMAAGLIMGGKAGGAVFLIGASLKLFGDEEFMIDVIKMMYRTGDVIHGILKEAVMSGLTFRAFDPSKVEGFANIKRAFQIAAEEISMEDAMKGVSDSIIPPTESMKKLIDKLTLLQEKSEAGIEVDLQPTMDEIVKLRKEYEFAIEKVKTFRVEAEKPIKFSWMDIFVRPESPIGMISQFFRKPTSVEDFILQPGGKLIKTDPNDTIMGSKSGFGSGDIHVTYNITGVSSPDDIKEMLAENNRQLTEDVRRSIGG